MSTLHALVLAGIFGLAPAAHAAGVAASSALTDDDGVRRDAEAAFDGRLTTSWCEDEPGDGTGAWVEVRLDRPTPLASVSLWPGDLSRGARSLKEAGRPHTVSVLFDGVAVAEGVRVRDGAEHGEQRIDIPVQGEARVVRVQIDQAYRGYLRSDACIAEVALNFVSGEAPPSARLDGWVASAAGQKAAERHRDEVIALFDRIDAAQFGDRDAMAALMGYAADGAPWLRERVRREVPPGFRLGALPPDEVALEALLKLKDANAIPSITLASLRSTGERQRRLDAVAGYFKAFAELKGGGRRSIGDWGVEGWERGALRSFGEPLGVALADDRLFVADVANHRVARFTVQGRPEGDWGAGEPTVTDTWLEGRRPFYVSGRTPDTKPGAFTHPLAVATSTGRDGVRVYVLDASKRVQVLDEDGRPVASWSVPAELGAAPGVGGAAHLLLARKGVVVIWGNEGFVLSPKDGSVTAQWTIQDGAPITAALLKNGKLALGFPSGAAVAYGLDGFRHATLLTSEHLPLGFEGWALGTDPKGRLWAVTDHGWALKFKKPGVEDYRVRWNEVAVRSPRFVVADDILWIVADGRIRRFDALEAKAEAAVEADAP